MKKYLSIFTVAILLFASCSEQLDRFPVDSLVEETAYNDTDDLSSGLAGALGNYNYNGILAFNSIFTDNGSLGVDNGGQQLNLLNQILNADTGDQGLWTNRYGVINDFNRLLEAAEGITPASTETDDYNFILAQSYAFRALAHYEILLYYGLDITDPSAAGVPYVDYVSADATPARNTTAEVLAGINADLDRTLELLPAGSNDINFATRDFVDFLRMRIALNTENYSSAISLATKLIAKYPLATRGQYFDMFNEDASTVEVIWKYDNVQGANQGYNFNWNFTGQNPFIEMSAELFNLLDDDDIRKAVLLDDASVIEAGEYVIGKYPPNADTQSINDYKAMRISEAYLTRAEAYARTGQFDEAAEDIEAIRDARFSDDDGDDESDDGYDSLQEALADIIEERRIELAYEGHRYIDIKRTRDVLGGIERDDEDCGGAVPCALPASSEKFIFPIPTGEINGNPNITQAPGY